jgi:hypothetical protein
VYKERQTQPKDISPLQCQINRNAVTPYPKCSLLISYDRHLKDGVLQCRVTAGRNVTDVEACLSVAAFGHPLLKHVPEVPIALLFCPGDAGRVLRLLSRSDGDYEVLLVAVGGIDYGVVDLHCTSHPGSLLPFRSSTFAACALLTGPRRGHVMV